MKISKTFMKRLLIIVLCVFVILPMILLFLGVSKKPEGFYVKDGANQTIAGFDISGLFLSDGRQIVTMDPVSEPGQASYCTSGVLSCRNPGFTLTNIGAKDSSGNSIYKCIDENGNGENDNELTCIVSNGNYTGATGEALYCAFGDVSCVDPTYTLTETRTDSAGNKLYQCKNGEDICANAMTCQAPTLLTGATSSVTLYPYGNDNCPDMSGNTYEFKEFNFNGTSLTEGHHLNGFSTPYTSAPFSVDGSYVIFADKIDVSYSQCFFYETADQCNTRKGKCEEETDYEECAGVGAPIEKCVADYGAQIGDKLCCGQTGVVQKNDRICPYSKPLCKGFKCGSQWGECVSNSDNDVQVEEDTSPTDEETNPSGTEQQQVQQMTQPQVQQMAQQQVQQMVQPQVQQMAQQQVQQMAQPQKKKVQKKLVKKLVKKLGKKKQKK